MRIIRALALAAAALAAGGASAGGAYDGIYNVPNSPLYVAIFQNGSHIIAGQYYTVKAQDMGLSAADGFPPSLNFWDVFGGDIAGNTVTVSGEAILSACNFTNRIVFDATGMTMQLLAASNTAYGNQIGINCGALPGAAQAQRFNRVF